MSSSSRSRRAFPALLAISLTTICGACAHKAEPAAQARELPPPAANLMQPVAVPPLHKGDNAKARLAETRDALGEANRRLEGGRAWYQSVRDFFRGGGEK